MTDPSQTPVLIEQRLAFFKPHLAPYRLIDWTEETIDAVLAAHSGIRAIVTVGEKPLPPAIAALPSLGLVALMGAGFEGIEAEKLRARGVEVTHAPGANAADVADQALALFLALIRGVIDNDRRVRTGLWVDRGAILTAPSVRDQRVGIVGMGAIGQALAQRFAAFGCTIAWHGPRPKPDIPYPRYESLLDLARETDVLVLAHRANESNAGLVSAQVIEAIGPTGYLVNVSRGSAVDEAALIAALREGRLGGAAIDVFEPEPVTEARWADVPRCVLSPHIGGVGMGAWKTIGGVVRDNLDRFFAGSPLASPVPRD